MLALFLMVGLWRLSHQHFLQYALPNCSVRYEIRRYYNYTCEEVHAVQPICKRRLRIAYSNFPPYVFQDKNMNVKGFIPAFFNKVINETCCLGCGTQLEYLPQKSHKQKVMDQYDYTKAADIAVPIQNFNRIGHYTAMYYSTIMDLEKIDIVGVLEPPEPANKMTSLFKSLIQTWPLLLMTFAMAIGAGSIVWVLDNQFNKEQFPDKFPDGMFEGIWWAFVSMTTVGYGDRTPSFWGARLFAVVWIFFGVTFFGMYLGTITSVMTTNLQTKNEFEVKGQKIGVLSWTNAPKQKVIEMQGIVEEFENVEDMIQAFKVNTIYGIAMDENMIMYFLPRIQRVKAKARIQIQGKTKHHGIGLVSNDKALTSLVSGFYAQNVDNVIQLWLRDIMNEMVEDSVYTNKTMEEWYNIVKKKKLEKETEPDLLFTYKHPSFLICLVSMFVTSCLCILINKVMKRNNDSRAIYVK